MVDVIKIDAIETAIVALLSKAEEVMADLFGST